MNWPYIIKHWGYTLLLGTTILNLVSGFKFLSPSEIGNTLAWFIIYLLSSAIYSVPTLIAYVLVFFTLIKRNINLKWIKSILIFVTISGITLTTLLIDSSMLEDLTIYYLLSAVATGILFKIQKT